MAITISQTVTALGVNAPASFLASGGTAPYIYAVQAGGAGGTINATTGTYIAPSVIGSNNFDTIMVTDSLSASATTQILVGTPLLLFCDIIQNQLGLANGRVYLWDQKIMQPKDNDLYVAVSISSLKPFSNSNQRSADGLVSNQSVNMWAMVDIDIISRGSSALLRKEEVIMALESDYARSQQDTNAFYIGKISTQFLNLSNVDGDAIPYRFRISVAMQYIAIKNMPTNYFNSFNVTTIEEP